MIDLLLATHSNYWPPIPIIGHLYKLNSKYQPLFKVSVISQKLALEYIDYVYIQIPPGNYVLTLLSGSEHCSVGLEHCIVDEFLVLGECAIGREGAGDVRGIAVVLSTHVEETTAERRGKK